MSDLSTLEIGSNLHKRQKRIFSFLTSSKVPPVPLDHERRPYVSIFSLSNFTFFWVFGLIKTGYSRTIQPSDLPKLTPSLKVEGLVQEYQINLKNYHEKEQKDSSEVRPDYVFTFRTFIKAFVVTFKWKLIFLVVTYCLGQIAQSVTSLLNKKLIEFCSYRYSGIQISSGKGVGYSFGVCLLILTAFVLENVGTYVGVIIGTQVKAVLTKLILEKAFRANAESRAKFPPSKLTTLLGADLSKIEVAFFMGPAILAVPFTFAISLVLLAINLKITTLVVLGILLVLLVYMFYFTKLVGKQRRGIFVFTDARVEKVKEMIESLKIIKYFSWEVPFFNNISDARIKESNKIAKVQYVRNILVTSIVSIGPISSLVTFVVLSYVDKSHRTPANVFSSLSLIEVLASTFTTIPFSLASIIDAWESMKRISEFLNSGEATVNENIIHNEDMNPLPGDLDQAVLKLENATFSWVSTEEPTEVKKSKRRLFSKKKPEESKPIDIPETKDSIEDFKLSNINLNVNKGELVIVTGVVGSGKSSLLNAIAGRMPRTEGYGELNGTMLFCGQPWVQNATIKENIIFGGDFDEKRYQQCIYSCALVDDLKTLPAGDRTEVGERGITLSGGQKARLSLARAVYASRDILLLDDVLSAVDAKVGKHIMDNCIGGLLGDKTRILATHQLSFLNYADKVVFLNSNGTVDIGTMESLTNNNQEFVTLLAHRDREDKGDDETETETTPSFIEEELADIEKRNPIVEEQKEIFEKEDVLDDGKLIEDEISAENSVKWDVYKHLFVMGSNPLLPFVFIPLAIFFTIIPTFCLLFTNTWLSFWTEYKFEGKDDPFYIGIYAMLSILNIPLTALLFITYVRLTIQAAKLINIEAMKRFLYVPMSYMDTTPIGRILNRFTKDADSLDNQLVVYFRLLFWMGAQLIGYFILSAIYLPWLIIAFPIIVLVLSIIASFYQATSREVQRLESTQRSFVFNNFTESLEGLDVIKNYNAQARFLEKNDTSLDKCNEAEYIVNAVQRWANILVLVLAVLYIFAICLLSTFGVFDISPASVGLIISYSIVIPIFLTEFIRNQALVENQMTSFERIYEYAKDLPQEAAYTRSDISPPSSWPSQGSIVFSNASMRYRDGLPKVLKNVNVEIKGSEKIGICGRTGAGKSTITSLLFRLTELCEGSIHIDGIDISDLGLHELRSKLSIIPQESVLFDGNIRKNLDPFGEVDDEILWKALVKTGLIEEENLTSVKAQDQDSISNKFHLYAPVESGGKNFSLGEKQLISFSRALVRNSKILILDEATSSVDYVTDAKIQKKIKDEFGHCTILCIAHRLRTIIDYDKILVLDEGQVKEFDTPKSLFLNEISIFRMLCDKSSITLDEFK